MGKDPERTDYRHTKIKQRSKNLKSCKSVNNNIYNGGKIWKVKKK